jgi:hypothetical protein
MLIGHYAPALVLQRLRPSLALWPLLLAVQLVDLAWGVLVLVGVEHVRIVPGFTASNDLDLYDMPYTHSLAATGVWVLGAFAVWLALVRRRALDGAVLALAVASHFVLDWVVHAGDLPLAAGAGPKLGLGLWNHRWAALALECGLFAASALFWIAGARRSRGAVFFLAALTVFAAASFFIPTPPSPAAMAATGLATWLALAHWASRVER